jgi:hypothetical protein
MRAQTLACRLSRARFRRICAGMAQFLNITDHDRLPWRFYGATRAVLARA